MTQSLHVRGLQAVLNRSARIFGSGGVLAYHGVGRSKFSSHIHISADVFRDHLVQLKRQFRFLPLEETVERVRGGKSLKGCLSLTFDDAYVGVVAYASRTLEELEVPATVFVCSGAAMRGGYFWWDMVEFVCESKNQEGWDHLTSELRLPHTAVGDSKTRVQLRNRILTEYHGRGDLVEEILKPYTGDLGHPWRSATFEELQGLRENELVDFGSHTVNHPVLPLLSFDDQVEEMHHCFTSLKTWLPRVRPLVAYPYGLFDATTLRAAAVAGFSAGFGIDPRPTTKSTVPMCIPRVCGEGRTDLTSIPGKLSGLYRFARALRKRK